MPVRYPSRSRLSSAVPIRFRKRPHTVTGHSLLHPLEPSSKQEFRPISLWLKDVVVFNEPAQVHVKEFCAPPPINREFNGEWRDSLHVSGMTMPSLHRNLGRRFIGFWGSVGTARRPKCSRLCSCNLESLCPANTFQVLREKLPKEVILSGQIVSVSPGGSSSASAAIAEPHRLFAAHRRCTRHRAAMRAVLFDHALHDQYDALACVLKAHLYRHAVSSTRSTVEPPLRQPLRNLGVASSFDPAVDLGHHHSSVCLPRKRRGRMPRRPRQSR